MASKGDSASRGADCKGGRERCPFPKRAKAAQAVSVCLWKSAVAAAKKEQRCHLPAKCEVGVFNGPWA